MFCDKCGKYLENKYKYCPYCGNSFIQEETEKEKSSDKKAVIPVETILGIEVFLAFLIMCFEIVLLVTM